MEEPEEPLLLFDQISLFVDFHIVRVVSDEPVQRVRSDRIDIVNGDRVLRSRLYLLVSVRLDMEANLYHFEDQENLLLADELEWAALFSRVSEFFGLGSLLLGLGHPALPHHLNCDILLVPLLLIHLVHLRRNGIQILKVGPERVFLTPERMKTILERDCDVLPRALHFWPGRFLAANHHILPCLAQVFLCAGDLRSANRPHFTTQKQTIPAFLDDQLGVAVGIVLEVGGIPFVYLSTFFALAILLDLISDAGDLAW